MNQNPIDDSFPLSPMQQGMLFHFLNEPHSGVDIEQVVVHLSETIDVIRLEAAWQWLAKRHAILRARFVWDDCEEPRQDILVAVSVPFEVEDGRELSKDARHDRLTTFLQTDRVRGFELNSAPMLRLTLFQWRDAAWTLVWTFHHALLDGRCFPILLREVFEVYAELAKGEIAARPAPFPYRRHIDWLRQQSFASAELFWNELLAGFAVPTPLVVDGQIPEQAVVYRQGEAWATVDRATTTRLRTLAEAHGLTVNSLFMGTWAILLHRYSGEEDMVFGATRACRKSSVANADQTIGLFINTVPVRVRLRRDDTVLSVCQAVRRQWLDVRPYEHMPLPRVKALSHVPPTQPLFETLLVFENQRLDTVMRSLGGSWAARQVDLHELTNFPITLAAYDGEELSLKIEFDRRCLDDAAAQRLLGHVRRLLDGVAANSQAAVGDLPFVTDTERRELVETFNMPAQDLASSRLPRDGGATLHGLFEAEVAQRPGMVALTCEGQSLTYEQLNAQANRLARQLRGCGVKPDALVGLCLDRSNELVVAILAILKAGGAYLPIDLAYPAERLAFMLEDAQAPVLLTHSTLRNTLPPTMAKVLCVDEVLAQPMPAGEANLPPLAGPDHLAYVIYTSGTTGKPKGSLITHRNAARLFSATEHWYGFTGRDVWTLFHSCAFDFSVWEIWGALLYGGRVVVVPFRVSRSPEAFYELLAKEQVTVLNQTPSAFRQLIQAEASVGQQELALRYVILGGEALELQSLRPWFDRHGDQKPRLVNMYGITETTVHVTYRPLSKGDLQSGSVIGVPIPDLPIYLLDAQRQPVPVGVPGELYVGGAGVARGYLHRPELTAERFVLDHLSGRPGSRLYKTGDLARFLPGRDIEYLGRIDQQVKIRGFRIELGEIQSVLCQHPAVREAVVIAREDVPATKRLVAYVVATMPAPDVSSLRDYLKKKLPEYMVPAAFVFLGALPLTTNGKLDHKALPIPDQHPELADGYVAPRTRAEQELAAIWSRVLRIGQVGVNDNFFALGGDSILSIQIISLARAAGLTFTPTLLFANQTVAELAAVAGMADAPPSAPEVVSGDVPLTPIQHWFFEQNLDEYSHYNQAFLFKTTERLDRSLLESALTELGRHHDALRLRYVRDGDGWRQFYSPSEEPAPLRWMRIAPQGDVDQRRIVETVAASTQTGLALDSGPLWRAVYFDLGSEAPGRLLLVVHHLAVDGVSWRLLLEDLERAYRQLQARQALQPIAKTTSYGAWARRLRQFANAHSLQDELPYWRAVTDSHRLAEATTLLATREAAGVDTEASAQTLTTTLTVEETRALLHQIPAVYNTHINDVLLTAMARAWHRCSGSRVLFTHLEAHGRENLFEDVDLSRTVGWFTSLFPVRLELPETGDPWQPGTALKAVKEQLRQIPRHGIGYGVLRYLGAAAGLSTHPEPEMVFNYLGQFDQILTGSTLFSFAQESTGPWHGPTQRRRHALETNSLVINGRLELSWTYSHRLSHETVSQLASSFVSALRELIEHCQSSDAGGRTPSDFPLSRLDQSMLDRLVAAHRDIEDIYPLSPVQTLFFSANSGAAQVAFDQWQCTLRGTLNVPALQRAWQETVRRHTILRSTIHESELPEPVQIVHRDVTVPWTIEDWRHFPSDGHEERWSTFARHDRAQPLTLTEAPLMRFGLARLGRDTWKFLWSVPALLLDGWSWPVVFRDVSRLYHAVSHDLPPRLDPARPYRDYLEWLGRQPSGEPRAFWRAALAGLREPTALLGEGHDTDTVGPCYLEHPVRLSTGTTSALQLLARRLQLTLNTLVQGAWALLLHRHSRAAEVVFGAAFAGRPTDLPGVESIVGPFVNSLPIRVAIDTEVAVGDLLRQLHTHVLALSPFQFTPLLDIQRCSEVPWRHRLFNSMVVFQNYLVDESIRRFGGEIEIADFVGPIHTNYPIMVLAEPGAVLRLRIIYDRRRVATPTVERWGADLGTLLERMPSFHERRVAELAALLSPPAPASVSSLRRLRAESQTYAAPQTDTERAIADVWQNMLGTERVSTEENLFDLGAHSLLLIQMHARLRETLNVDFPIVTLFEHPTVRALARHLDQPVTPTSIARKQWRERAERQQQALARWRGKVKKSDP
jgi:amino acid adenylation domain-containing protein/non-ribosomal peptide synthase protein (TIGR01720 family)